MEYIDFIPSTSDSVVNFASISKYELKEFKKGRVVHYYINIYFTNSDALHFLKLSLILPVSSFPICLENIL